MTVRAVALAALATCLMVVPSHSEATGAIPAPDQQTPDLGAVAERAVQFDAKACGAVILRGRDGGPSTIIASLDYSGRSLCGEVVRVSTKNPPVVLQRFVTSGVAEIASIVRDLDNDGNPEIVIPNQWGYGRHARCEPIHDVIYQCDARTCSDASARFIAYYSEALDRLNIEIDRLLASGSEGEQQLAHCDAMERDRLLRFLGLDQSAGFAAAEQWMRSTDQDSKLDAVAVFKNIGDQSSKDRLQVLASDTDATVQLLARRALQSLNGAR
jgi:hypothetical protein